MTQKVHCHSQEYRALGRQRCRCGVTYNTASVLTQRLEHRANRSVDVLSVRCANCGTEDELEFDISSFAGKPDLRAFQQLLADADRAWKMYVWHELRMESLMEYLSELAADGDRDALAYIAEAASQFLEKARATEVPS